MDINDRINNANKADKAGDIIELVAEFIFGIGSSFLVNKAMSKIYTPKNVTEKILMGIGSGTVGIAISHCAGETVHEICHPYEKYKQQKLINQLININDESMELSKEIMQSSRTIRNQGDLLCKVVDFPDDMEDNGINFNNFTSHINIDGKIDIPESNLLKEEENDGE